MIDRSRINEIFAAIDARDTQRFLDFLTSRCGFRFGNMPPASGKDAIARAVGGFFASVAGLSHEVLEVWLETDAAICHGLVTYTRADGSRLTVPFADIFRFEGDLISEYLIFIDISQL